MTPPVPPPMLTPRVRLDGLQTESRNHSSSAIDRVSTQELCRILNREDSRVPAAIEPCIPVIADVIDVLAERVHRGGRVMYIGAGTSGRLGVLDASEIPPTYSAPEDLFVALIAGGDTALRKAKEGAEDSRRLAEADLKALSMNPEHDTLIGIASSGRTPYVLGGLSYARSLGCVTVGLVCVQPSAVSEEGNADHVIAAVTGPEVVTGSTRMKAGTATKMILNMISTGIMIREGKTYGNLMVDLKATNFKLRQRARNILRTIAGSSCTESDEELDRQLAACNGSVKVAAITMVLQVSALDAELRLGRHQGRLKDVFQEERERKRPHAEERNQGLVLCVDAGGSSCKAVIMTDKGAVGHGTAGPCNVASIGINLALRRISKAIQEAIDDCDATRGLQLQAVRFTSALIGIAGYDRPSLSTPVTAALSELLPIGDRLRVMNDVDLIPLALQADNDTNDAIVLIAGTGSVAMSYRRSDGTFQRSGRSGGWGHLLGDEGSGYWLGREALRRTLSASDLRSMSKAKGAATDAFSALSRAVFDHFQLAASEPRESRDLLSEIVAPSVMLHADDATLEITKRIAGVARVVLDMASADDEARSIVEDGARSLAQLVSSLIEAQDLDMSRTVLVLAGGLMQDELYRSRILELVRARSYKFSHVEIVDQPAVSAAKFLSQRRNL